MPEREPLTDEEYERRSAAERARSMPTAFERNWPVPTPAPPPGPWTVTGWPVSPGAIGWPATGEGHGELAHPVAPLPAPAFTFPPAPVGSADRRPNEAAPPPPSAAPPPGLITGEVVAPPITGDERWDMNLIVPKSVGQAWEQRQPFPPGPAAGFAPGAVAAVAPPGGGVSALDIGGPAASLERFRRMEALNAEQEQLYKDREAVLQPQRDLRKGLEDKMAAELAEYRAGIAAARPPLPKLEKMPTPPDVKIRPWLDPEGKAPLMVIAETLAMFAVGVGGALNKAPLTAMKYFREAAENWRRDEVDTANSKLKQFEMAVQVVKNDNDLALKQYDLADKEYAHNVEAKKALVTSRLDELNLHDHALEATQKPYDEALAAVKARLASVATVQKSATDYMEAVAKLTKGAATMPKTPFGLGGFITEGKRQLADPNLDPAVRKDLEQKVPMAERWLDDHRKRAIADAQAKNQNVATTRIGAARQKDGYELLHSATYIENQLKQLGKDYERAFKGGGLPQSNTIFDDYFTKGKTALTRLSPETQGALENIKKFAPELQVSAARTFLNDRGVQSIKAMGEITHTVMSYPAALAVLRRWDNMVQAAKRDANRLITEGQRALDTPDYSGALPAAEPTETEETE